MAGSIKTFVYTTDQDRACCINMDESNGEAVGNPDFDLPVINPVNFLPGIPSGISPRVARYQSDDGRVSKAIIVCLKTLLASLPSVISVFFPQNATAVTPVDIRLKSITNESYKAYTGVDTGLNDGDFT